MEQIPGWGSSTLLTGRPEPKSGASSYFSQPCQETEETSPGQVSVIITPLLPKSLPFAASLPLAPCPQHKEQSLNSRDWEEQPHKAQLAPALLQGLCWMLKTSWNCKTTPSLELLWRKEPVEIPQFVIPRLALPWKMSGSWMR